MSESYVKIGADGINAEEIVRQIRERARTRRHDGDLEADVIARAERFNLSAIKDDDEFFDQYIASLGIVSFVDINDYEIHEHRARFSKLLVKFKKTIWSVLRFYTYHLWSQQNQVNRLFHAAFELLSKRNNDQIRKLQKRVDALEARLAELESKNKG